ncbi:MAG: hypothetical protein EAX86_02280 [Candidatus Heimdallarchaeota archaeon]|nr:hypothetical protein [Candidatus Heimdallarchaeota archaeon]
MKISRYIIPLSFVFLFILNAYALSFDFTSIKQEVTDGTSRDKRNVGYENLPVSSPSTLQIGSTITVGRTTLTTDEDTYSPGDWVTISAESSTDDMNGSLEWRLESPIEEVAFDFYSDYQDVFSDPSFDGPGLPSDWTNIDFDFANVMNGYLNLTEEADADTNNDEIYFYNPLAFVYGNKYVISFDHYSYGENLLINPGFETGDSTGWEVNSSYVIIVNSPENASEGDYYANVNGTRGYLITQNVTGWTGGREAIFSARATGTTAANYWSLRLEAYNSTGGFLGAKDTSTDSQGDIPDEKGYTFNRILRWVTPINTSYLRAMFRGRDGGSNSDGLYTGWVDDLFLSESPAPLLFSYYGVGGEWKTKRLLGGTNEWEHTTRDTFLIELASTAPTDSKTIKFLLDDTSDAINKTTSYWLIDNVTINFVTKPEVKTGISEVQNTGFINSTWFHRGYQEELKSTYKIKQETPENVSTIADCSATIKILLPQHQIYFGPWIFILKIHRIDSASDPLDVINVNISFVVDNPMNYVIQDIYLLRGSTNISSGDDYVFKEYFEPELGIEAISPGDNVTLLGYLEANSTQGEWYDFEFLQVSETKVEFFWYSSWSTKENITWSQFGFIPYQKDGITLLDGNFSSPTNNIRTMGLNFHIPNRGIFGDIVANLTLSIRATNAKPGGVGGGVHKIIIPLNLPPVKFNIVVEEENLPGTSYYLTDYISGNITLNLLNYNSDLPTEYPGRNITSNLTIPMTDLDFVVYLDLVGGEVEVSQEFHYNIIGKSILWLEAVNPHLLAGNYSFKIRWGTAYEYNDTNRNYLDISTLYIAIRGTLAVHSSDTVEIKQGGMGTIQFNVTLLETTKKISGLNLLAVIEGLEAEGTIVIYENEGLYNIDILVPPDAEVRDDYVINIFVKGRSDTIGEVQFSVIESTDTLTTPVSLLDLIVTFGGFIFFITTGIGVVGVLFWFNKKF